MFITRLPIAHRGLHDGNKRVFENSISAFSAAIEAGYAIELDVQLSADGIAVVFHDATLDRITNQSGLVKERTAEELQKIKLGKTHDVIDTLEDVLLEIAGHVPVIIEMKGTGDPTDARDLASAVAADLEHYSGDVAVMSFDHDLLRAFAHTKSKAPLGLTAEGIMEADFERHHVARDFGIKFVSYAVDHLPNAFVDVIRNRYELPIITWTVRTPEQVKVTMEHADQMTFEGFLP